ncbi:MAG TPA: cohesin domain-containing protein [Candidatus Saccharimonadales bacterium]
MNNKKSKIIFAFVAVFLIVTASVGAVKYIIPSAYAAGGDQFYISPSSGSYQNGNNFTVTVTESSTDPINSLQANVNFDVSKLQFVSISSGSAAGSPFTNVNQATVSGSQVQIGESVQPGTQTGQHNVATITFKVLGGGNTSTVLSFDPSSGMFDPVSSQAVWGGSTTGATFTLASAPAPICPAGDSGTYPNCVAPTPPPTTGGGSVSTGGGSTSNSGSTKPATSTGGNTSSSPSVATPNNQLSTSSTNSSSSAPSSGNANNTAATNTTAGSQEISVKVVNADNKPVVDATVTLNNLTSKTNTYGIATFNALPGEYKVNVKGNGIKPYSKALVVEPGKTTQYTLTAQNSGPSTGIIVLCILLFFAFDSIVGGIYLRAKHIRIFSFAHGPDIDTPPGFDPPTSNNPASNVILPPSEQASATTMAVVPETIITPAIVAQPTVISTETGEPLMTPIQVISPTNPPLDTTSSQQTNITSIDEQPTNTNTEPKDDEVKFG